MNNCFFLAKKEISIDNVCMAKYHLLKHFHTVNKHRWLVFIHCCRCGIPFRGLVHDLSKYSPSEFLVSARNYSGTRSPIANERREENGYSKAFIHHTRKNRHHYEYWVDVTLGDIVLSPMPYPFALESCCDMIAASKVYNGKKYTKAMPLSFFNMAKKRSMMHSATKEFIETILKEYRDFGFKKLKKKFTKKLYQDIIKKYPKTEVIEVYSKEKQLIQKPFNFKQH